MFKKKGYIYLNKFIYLLQDKKEIFFLKLLLCYRTNWKTTTHLLWMNQAEFFSEPHKMAYHVNKV